MRKDIPIVILSLFLLLFSGQAALASQAEWQIHWQDDGTLLETVNITDFPIQNADAAWKKTVSGNQIQFTRTVSNWDEYNRLQDKLPLQAAMKNYVFFNYNTLSASEQVAAGSLYASLRDIDKLDVKINVPIVVSSSVAPSDKQTVVWAIDNPGQRFNKDFSLKAISLDGLMLGISILTVGVFCLFIFFMARMRKVDRLIEETYSLDNVVIEDDEIDAEDS